MDFEKEAKWMMWIMFAPAIVGIPFGILLAAMQNQFNFRFFISMVLQLTGAYLIYRAKSRTLKSGNLTTFGTKNMTKIETTKYIFGYLFLAVGILVAIGLALKLTYLG